MFEERTYKVIEEILKTLEISIYYKHVKEHLKIQFILNVLERCDKIDNSFKINSPAFLRLVKDCIHDEYEITKLKQLNLI